MSPGDRCPTCGSRERVNSGTRRRLEELMRRKPPPTPAEASDLLGVSRQRVYQLLDELELRTPSRRGRKPTKERARG